MVSRKYTIETKQHPRFIEFKNSRFYASDFVKPSYKFLTLLNIDNDILKEYAHINYNKWVTSNNQKINSGQIIQDIDNICINGLYLDLYVTDIFKPNASIRVKRVYRYLLIPTGETQSYKGNVVEGGTRIRRLYDLIPIDDVGAIHTLSQIISEI